MPLSTPQNRVRYLCNMHFRGIGDSFAILRADFNGTWPPYGLETPAQQRAPVKFKSMFKVFSDSSAHVSNQETEAVIHINQFSHIGSLMQMSSHKLANSISHENIHLLQKSLIKGGVRDPFGRFRRHQTHLMIKDNKSQDARYYCAEDEIQVRLHLLIAQHYRERGKIPMNKHELWSFLHHQGVHLHQECVNSLTNHQAGIKARHKFFVPRIPLFKSEPVRDLNTAIAFIDPKKRADFCMITLPILYGSLLELYGDYEGSERMGYDCNITNVDLFFRHAWRINHKIETNTSFSLDQCREFLRKCSPKQQQTLQKILEESEFRHPLSGHLLTITPVCARVILPLFGSLQAFEKTEEFNRNGQPTRFQLN